LYDLEVNNTSLRPVFFGAPMSDMSDEEPIWADLSETSGRDDSMSASRVRIITDIAALHEIVEDFMSFHSIALDIEAFCVTGRALGRISLLQFGLETGEVYLVDALCFRRDELRSALSPLLEFPFPVKLMYDCRVDAHALYAQFGIRLRGVLDLQLLGTYLRVRDNPEDNYRAGLRDALHKYLEVRSLDAADVKAAMRSGLKVWDVRPLTPSLVKYAAGDVHHLHALLDELEDRTPSYFTVATRRLTERFLESYTTHPTSEINTTFFDSFVRVRKTWLHECREEAQVPDDMSIDSSPSIS